MNVDANFMASSGFASVRVVVSNSVGEVMISVELYCLVFQCGRSGASCVLGCTLHRCHSVQNLLFWKHVALLCSFLANKILVRSLLVDLNGEALRITKIY